MEMSKTLANEVLDAVMNGGTLSYSNLYLAIHDGAPGDTGANEIAIARLETAPEDWLDASNKVTSTTKAFEFTSMPATTVTHISLWDSLTGGTFLWSGELTISKTVPAGETLRFDVGNIVAEIDPAV